MIPGQDAGQLRRPAIAAVVVLGLAAGAVAGWWTNRGDDDAQSAGGEEGVVAVFPAPLALLGAAEGPVSVVAGSVVEVDATATGAAEGDAVLLNLVVTGAEQPGEVRTFACGTDASGAPQSGFDTVASSSQLVSAVGANGRLCVESTQDANIEIEAIGRLTEPRFSTVQPAAVLLDTRTTGATVDGAAVPAGPVTAGTTLELVVTDLDDASVLPLGMVALTVDTTGRGAPGEVTVRACDATTGSVVGVRANERNVRSLVVPVGMVGAICITSSTPTDIAVELTGAFEPSLSRAFADPVRIVDTRAEGMTFDARFAGIGVRPESSTLEVPVTDRIGAHDGLVALVLNVAADRPLDDGRMSVFPAGSGLEQLASMHYSAGASSTTTAIVPVRAGGEICVATTGRADVVVDLVGLLTLPPTGTTATVPADPVADSPGCPQQSLFPDRRMVAMYGSDRTPRLGVLGEQDAVAAADRLATIAAPWREGDRPVLPAFELIATLATADDGDDGLHRLRSSHDVVQHYLDVARRHGYYLILDIQPGWSDFLTEAMYYEPFLRESDVGLALDPEWRTRPPDPPAGGYVGQTDAAEVNAVAEWLARIVAEEDLPEKLLVIHQFQERMVLERDQVVEPPGIALTFHMDGFGTRGQKQHTWSLLRVSPPWSNGLKLFYDEDVEIYQPAEILAGAFDPVPDLITHQ